MSEWHVCKRFFNIFGKSFLFETDMWRRKRAVNSARSLMDYALTIFLKIALLTYVYSNFQQTMCSKLREMIICYFGFIFIFFFSFEWNLAHGIAIVCGFNFVSPFDHLFIRSIQKYWNGTSDGGGTNQNLLRITTRYILV